MSNTPRWTTSTGSTTAGCTPSSAWSHRPSTRPRTTSTTITRHQQRWRLPNNRSLHKIRGGSIWVFFMASINSCRDVKPPGVDVCRMSLSKVRIYYRCQTGPEACPIRDPNEDSTSAFLVAPNLAVECRENAHGIAVFCVDCCHPVATFRIEHQVP